MKDKSRRDSIKEGIFTSAKSSFGDTFLSPFAIAINTSNFLVAFLSSVVGVLGPLSQIFGSRLIEKTSRKKIILKAIGTEIFFWVAFALIAFLFFKGIITSFLPVLFFILFAFYVIINHSSYPAWFSWTGDIIGERSRGRWFSKRNFYIGFTGAILSISAALILEYFKGINLEMIGFFSLFLIASIFRFICFKIYKKQYEPKIKFKKDGNLSFSTFVLNLHKNNLGRFALFRSMFSFANAISSSLLVIYLLRILGFNYLTYMIIVIAGIVFSLLAVQLWGKFADRYGNYRLVLITSSFISITPVLWILFPNPLYLIFVPSMISGIMWAGFNLAEGNFIYDNSSQQRRGPNISYYNMVSGTGTFLGAIVGGLSIKFISINAISSIAIIFTTGTILRLLIVLFWTRKLKEVKKKRHFDGTKSLKNLILKQVKPTLQEEFHEVMSIKKYLTIK